MMARRTRRKATSALWKVSSAVCGDERGAVAVILAIALIVLVGFAALVVDLGQIIIVRSELQNASDAGALSGVIELVYEGSSSAQTTATTYATRSDNYNLTSPSPASDAVDVNVLGPETLRVRVRRASGTSAGAVNTIFAPIWGIETAGVGAVAVATLDRRITGTGPGNLMPFGIHEDLVDADSDGNYDKGNVVDIYPHDYSPGNFGLLDLNDGSNSNCETRDWIESGYNDNFIIPHETGHVNVEGDPGISGGSLDGAINSRLGDRLLFPVFDLVTGNGPNTNYRVIDLVGGIIMNFKLTGSQSQRKIMVEIADFTANNLIVDEDLLDANNTVGVPVLIQ
jgi:Flp pilus assembly protein TadG